MAENLDTESMEGLFDPADELLGEEPIPAQGQTQQEPPSPVHEPQSPTPAPASEPEPFEIPEKYHGKTPEEIVRMHMEAERKLGEQGNELGQLRQARQYYESLWQQTGQQPQTPPYYQPPPTSPPTGDKGAGDDSLNELYWTRPVDVMEQTIEKYLSTREQRQLQQQKQQEQAQRQMLEVQARIALTAIRSVDPEVDRLANQIALLEITEPKIAEGAKDMFEYVNRFYQEAKKRDSETRRTEFVREFSRVTGMDPEQFKALNQTQRSVTARGMTNGGVVNRATDKRKTLPKEEVLKLDLLDIPEDDWD